MSEGNFFQRNKWPLIIAGAVVVGLIILIIVLAATGVLTKFWHWLESFFGSSSSKKLPTPTFPMSLLNGPYGISNDTLNIPVPTVILPAALKADTPSLWGNLGYRFVKVGASDVIDHDYDSGILWFNNVNKVQFQIYDSSKTTESINFRFWVPKPTESSVVSSTIKIQLMLTAWDNEAGTGEPFHKEIYVGLSDLPTSEDHIYVQYSTDYKMNQLLKTV